MRPAAHTLRWIMLAAALAFAAPELSAAPLEPHIQSTYTVRIVNRRFVSHLLYEPRGGEHYVTIILTHGPAYWAYHSQSYPLHAPCSGPPACYQLLQKLNKHLDSGRNLGLRLQGSRVIALSYYGTSSK